MLLHATIYKCKAKSLRCTPIELMEEIQVKKKLDARTDPVLEECYRMKEAFAAKFNSAQELHDYLKAKQKNLKLWVGNMHRYRRPELKKI